MFDSRLGTVKLITKPWAKVPRFSEGPWGMSSPRTSKTVRGTRAKRRVPRTVFEVRGLDIPQRSRGKMWNLIIIPWLCRFDTFIVVKDYFIKRGTLGGLFFNVPPFLRKTWDIGSTDFQCPTFFANWGDIEKQYSQCPTFFANRGDIEKQSSQCPTFYEIPWEMSRPPLKSKTGKTGV